MFCCYLKDALSKKLSLDAGVFVLRKKKHVHIAFKIPISEYESFDKLIDFLSDEWEKRKIFFEDKKMIYPLSWLRWNGNLTMSFLREKQKMENNALEKMYNKIVVVIYETFTRKYYFLKTSQSKKEHAYLIVRKKRGRLLGEEKNALHKKIFDIFRSVFHWYGERLDFLRRKYFFTPKLIKERSGYHFYYFIVSRDKYVHESYWTLTFVVFAPFLVISLSVLIISLCI